MTIKALIVEDDAAIGATVRDILDSLGHESECAGSLDKARQLMASGKFDYYLLDLEIPVRLGSSFPRVQNGLNLLGEIRQKTEVPVIVMSAYWKDGPHHAVEAMKTGAVDFVAKPFPTSGPDTLDNKIREALARAHKGTAPNGARTARPGQPFAGGDLIVFDDCVELLGVKIVGDAGTGQALQVIRQLAQRDRRGRWVRLSAQDIAEAIASPGGESSVTKCVYSLRARFERQMRERLNLICQSQDVIASGKEGYFLQDWITLRNDPAREPTDPDGPASDSAGERYRWVLEKLRQGVKLTRRCVQERYDISEKTAKRILAELADRIEFVRRGREGFYRMKSESNR